MESLFDSNIGATDCYYRDIRDSSTNQTVRDFLETLWPKYKPYADTDFRKNIASTFYQCFWEMYLTCALLEQGCEVVPRASREMPKRFGGPNAGPDVCLIHASSKIWVEAVAPERGTGKDAVPKDDLSPGPYILISEERFILRYQNAIDEKNKKYEQYLRKCEQIPENLKEKWLNSSAPFVVAIHGGNLDVWPLSPEPEDELPRIVKAVFPFGNRPIVFDPTTQDPILGEHRHRPYIMKKSKSLVSTKIFLDSQYKGISGILFSKTKPQEVAEIKNSVFIFIHNPNAQNPLSIGWLPVYEEYWVENQRLVLKRQPN